MINLSITATKETVDLTNKMADNGADAALVITPAYYKTQMNGLVLHKHFTHVSILFSHCTAKIPVQKINFFRTSSVYYFQIMEPH